MTERSGRHPPSPGALGRSLPRPCTARRTPHAVPEQETLGETTPEGDELLRIGVPGTAHVLVRPVIEGHDEIDDDGTGGRQQDAGAGDGRAGRGHDEDVERLLDPPHRTRALLEALAHADT